MKFVLNRDHTLASTMGHSVRFEKGVPQFVPSALYNEVIGIGGIPEEDIPEPDANSNTVTEPTDLHEREKAVFAAFEKLALGNKTGDFTSGGVPRDKAMERELGWSIESKDTAELWKKFKVKG